MNDLTRPSALLGYANTVGIAVATVYLANKTSALNVKYNDLAEEIETIRDGVKEKVPAIENTIKGLDQNLRNVATAVNNSLGGMNKRHIKTEKKMNKYKNVIEELFEVIEVQEARYNALVKALLDNKVLEDFKMEEAPVPPPVVKSRKVVSRKKRVLDDTESESESESDSESEEEKPKKKSKTKAKKKTRHAEDDDESDTNIVARMASRRG
jgi:hypothetical protein